MSVTERNKKKDCCWDRITMHLPGLLLLIQLFLYALLFLKLFTRLAAILDLQSFQTQIADWFTLPAAGYKFLTRPWTIITYMFSHDNLWYLISSLLWLWCFGYILQDLGRQ